DMVISSEGAASTPTAYDIILLHLSKVGTASRKDFEAVTGYGTTRTTAILNDMIKRGLINKIGKGKFTRYSLK
ncbi:MAG: helix-turn-helix domain-containing protein, partial [Bacillota bacterium]|nr:helix-turn-helix domain-containing protein [Bacillota bacterium]